MARALPPLAWNGTGMTVIYYVEVNLICICALLLIAHQHRRRADNQSASVVAFQRIIACAVLFCAADLAAGVLRGRMFPGARGLIELSNLVYEAGIVLVAYQWTRYVLIDFGLMGRIGKGWRILIAAPLAAFVAIAALNPLTGILFAIDDANHYVRNWGTAIHWVVAWGYLLTPVVLTFVRMRGNRARQPRRELAPYLLFIVAPSVASIVQMLCYGVTCIQAGVTLSILMLSLSRQSQEIVTDALTGLNNRRGLEKYFDRIVQTGVPTSIFAIMLDLNAFKSINDTYGHITGDNALREAADILREVCAEPENRVALCRYGGDEFVIAGVLRDGAEIASIEEDISRKTEERPTLSEAPYQLSFAMGSACGACSSLFEIDALLDKADEAMYVQKRAARQARG